jgi:hypothetical protein
VQLLLKNFFDFLHNASQHNTASPMNEFDKLTPEKRRRAFAILGIIFGLVLAIPGYWLFFRFQLHIYPELILKSARGFGLVIALAITGTGTFVWGLYHALRKPEPH